MCNAYRVTSPDPLQAARSQLARGQRNEALAAIDRLLARQPRHAEALVQRSLALIMLARYEEALSSASKAAQLAPGNPNAHSYGGSALLQLGRVDEALAAYERMVRLAPKAAVAHYNRANALRRLARWQDALASLDTALQLQPDYTDALTLAGIVLRSLGEHEAALQYYEQALRLQPQAADARYNRGLLLLALGRLEAGWDDYESRLQWEMAIRQGQSRAIERVAPDWDGDPLQQPLLVLPEQGVGDQIFYAGMLTDLAACLPGSVVCTEPRLLPLLTRSFGQLRFVTPAQLPALGQAFGAQIHIGSLGRLFRRQSADLARIRPAYLKADNARSAALRARVHASGKIICGLSWVSKNAEFGSDKSLSLRALVPMLGLPSVSFVDLQYGDTSTERQAMADAHGLSMQKLDDIDNFNDLDGLAALIDACDIVVTVSNTTAHLAAAVGKPVLVMLPASASLFWYWHVDRIDSPWYSTATLLRQGSDGWGGVVDTATAALREFSRGFLP